MTMGIKYILDTNVFVQAKNLYYQFHFCPGFWDWLCKLNPNGFLSIKNVYDEICYTNDELKEWVTKQQSLFVDFDNRSATKISEIKKLLDKKQVPQYQQTEFLSVADSFLVAFAMEHNCTIVTHEKLAANNQLCAKGKVQLPSVAKELGVPCKTIFNVIKAETNYKLILAN